MEKSKLGFFDRALLVLGLTLAGVIAFAMMAGVILALLKMFLDPRRSAKVHALTTRKDIPNADEKPAGNVLLDRPDRKSGRE